MNWFIVHSSTFIVTKSHLGSFDVVTDANANVAETFSFDVWGYRRKHTDWTAYDDSRTFLFNRGYTGHEHLDKFGIINMNGRLYDPAIARFFSPDPFVQLPDNTQSFNRYTYCMNNPMMYTDPTGNEWWALALGMLLDPISAITTATVTAGTASITAGATSAALYTTGSTILSSVHTALSGTTLLYGYFTGLGDPVKGSKLIDNALGIDFGLFRSDNTQPLEYQTWQVLARLTPFESIGYEVGNIVAHYYNLRGDVENVKNFYGATVVNLKEDVMGGGCF